MLPIKFLFLFCFYSKDLDFVSCHVANVCLVLILKGPLDLNVFVDRTTVMATSTTCWTLFLMSACYCVFTS